MKRVTSALALAAALAVLPFTLMTEGAAARVRYPEGIACQAARGPTLPYSRIAGVYLGGRNVGNHLGNSRDTRFFQSCFLTADACQVWLSRVGASYPLNPVVARCTSVELGGRTPGAPLVWPSPVRWF